MQWDSDPAATRLQPLTITSFLIKKKKRQQKGCVFDDLHVKDIMKTFSFSIVRICPHLLEHHTVLLTLVMWRYCCLFVFYFFWSTLYILPTNNIVREEDCKTISHEILYFLDDKKAICHYFVDILYVYKLYIEDRKWIILGIDFFFSFQVIVSLFS